MMLEPYKPCKRISGDAEQAALEYIIKQLAALLAVAEKADAVVKADAKAKPGIVGRIRRLLK